MPTSALCKMLRFFRGDVDIAPYNFQIGLLNSLKPYQIRLACSTQFLVFLFTGQPDVREAAHLCHGGLGLGIFRVGVDIQCYRNVGMPHNVLQALQIHAGIC